MDDPHLHMLLSQKDFRDMLWLRLCTELSRLGGTVHKESTVPQTKVLIAVGNEWSHVVLRYLIALRDTRPKTQN